MSGIGKYRKMLVCIQVFLGRGMHHSSSFGNADEDGDPIREDGFEKEEGPIGDAYREMRDSLAKFLMLLDATKEGI